MAFVAAVAGAALAGHGPVRADHETSYDVAGSAVSGACIPVAYDPVTSTADCHGHGYWTGAFQGPATYHATGVTDPVTGDATGTITEHLRVTASAYGKGEIYFTGDYTVEGATGKQLVHLTIREATGDFSTWSGTVRIEGTAAITGGPSYVTYRGSWSNHR